MEVMKQGLAIIGNNKLVTIYDFTEGLMRMPKDEYFILEIRWLIFAFLRC